MGVFVFAKIREIGALHCASFRQDFHMAAVSSGWAVVGPDGGGGGDAGAGEHQFVNE